MSILVEKKNKEYYLPYLEKALSANFSEIIFALKPTEKILLNDTHPRFRLMVMVDGIHKYKIQSFNGIKDVELKVDKPMFCQERGAMAVPKNTSYYRGTMLTFVFWVDCIRFLVSKYDNDSIYHWHFYHSHLPVSKAGGHILAALDKLASDNDSGIKACLLAKTLLYTCYENLLNDKSEKIPKSFYTYQRIKQYLYENSNSSINRESTAKTFGLSAPHISKLFAAYDEHNFNTVLKTLRLEHAVELLKETDFSIDEIAEECGFANTGYFIKTFRLSYGKTPGNFRQSPLSS